MKRRTLLIVIVVISLLLMAFPANASTITRDPLIKTQGSAQIHKIFNTDLEDIINIPPEGHHDNFTGSQNRFFCRAEGWAADANDLAADLNIKIFSDGIEVAQTTAETYRQDLEEAGVCQDGTCSFSIDLWGLFSAGEDHSISVQAQDAQTGDWSNLYDTPRTLNCFEAQAQTFVVNSTTDMGDAIQGNGVCETTTPGECTLRAAIMESNANPGADTINFNIPGAGPYTISPSYELDLISDPVIIDGTTQPGFSGTPIIELDGSSAGPDAHGIFIFAGASTVRGLVINRFAHTGIEIQVSGGNSIQGNYIGTDVTGTLSLGNADDGVLLLAPNNTIGGTTSEARNIISGNQEQGIRIAGSEATGNVVQGNFIGTDVTGLIALGNGTECCHSGVVIHSGASSNTIGGNASGAGNVISANTADGITIFETGTTENIVSGNFVGTDVTGTQALGNAVDGIVIFGGATDNLIGGTQPGSGNVVAANDGNGIAMYEVGSTGNMIQGNLIGADVTGSFPLGNSGHGVVIATGASHNLIGGTISSAGNTILFNNASGVLLSSDAGTGNGILSNSIYSNGDLGIDLGEDGVTQNDFFDADSGTNNLQNFPVIINTVESWKKGMLIQGAWLGTGSTSLRLEFFSNDACDAAGYGEGQTYLGFTEVKANPIGLAKFKFTLPTSLANGSFITATATDSANNTSEFSQCLQATP